MLWARNVPAWSLFQAVRTQWRVGVNGREGLDYGAVEIAMSRTGVPERDRDELFADLQVMEAAALDEWSKEQ